MEIAKALILAGPGRREGAWPTSGDEPRDLFPIANRPILVHNLQALRAAGVAQVGIVADRDAAAPIRRAVEDGARWDLEVRYVDAAPRAAIGDALVAAGSFLEGGPAVVQQGDVLLGEQLHDHITAFGREQLDALALRLSRPAPVPVRSPMPWYVLSQRAISLLGDRAQPGANPMRGVREQGGRVRVQEVDGCMPCEGDLDGLLEANRRMLGGLRTSIAPGSLHDCTIQGDVEIHPTATISRSLVRGPVIIGAGAQVSDAYIGPYTSIGAGVVVEDAEIEHSIVLADAELRFVGTRLESSVIGRRARIVRGFHVPRAIRVAIGDGAEVALA
jgi:glucose-1-phosphate thymidylyltransferase